MRKVYWRPRTVSRTALVLIAGYSLVGLILVEVYKVDAERPYIKEKLAATDLALQAMDEIYYEREDLGPEIDPATDPTESGLIGLAMSPVTSVSGQLVAKQTTINPNFAAVMVQMLKRCDVNEGDVVAAGVSGSFPALNICVYAAMETLKVRPIVIASASASQWGANVPDLLWIDMERVLAETGIFSIRCAAASVGGYEDRGLGMSEEGLAAIQKAIERNGLTQLKAEDFEGAINERLELYKRLAKGKPIKAYINVGGGAVSVGRSTGKRMFSPGLNRNVPDRVKRINGVMPKLIAEGTPVIHLVHITQLAERYKLPIAPVIRPEPAKGDVFRGLEYNKSLAAGLLITEILLLYFFIRSDVGFRLLRAPKRKEAGAPQPMV